MHSLTCSVKTQTHGLEIIQYNNIVDSQHERKLHCDSTTKMFTHNFDIMIVKGMDRRILLSTLIEKYCQCSQSKRSGTNSRRQRRIRTTTLAQRPLQRRSKLQPLLQTNGITWRQRVRDGRRRHRRRSALSRIGGTIESRLRGDPIRVLAKRAALLQEGSVHRGWCALPTVLRARRR